MRRIRPAWFLPPFRDGSALSADLRPIPGRRSARAQDMETLRRIRGIVVSLCVEIRNKLNGLVIIEDYGSGGFREHDLMLGKRVDFVTSTLGIAEKIECSRGMIRLLFKKRADGVLYRLFEANRLFHLMNSRPYFTVEAVEGTVVGYEICVADEQFIWTINESQVKEWVASLRRCIADLEEAEEKAPLVGEGIAADEQPDQPLRVSGG